MIRSIIQALSLVKIQPNISEQDWKRQSIYDLLDAETKPKFVYSIKSKENIFTENELLRKS